jgi:endogenous inhibitor of DNA gyrase (YacG/DUF329 family)
MIQDKGKKVSCPTCGKPVNRSAGQNYRPFCSERCKLVDLGSWLDESNRIPGESTPQTGENSD